MRRRLGQLSVAGAAVILMSGLPLVAQTSGTPGQKPPSTSQQPRAGEPSDTDTTVTGCIRSMRADTTAADTKGSIYMLEVMDSASVGAAEVGAPAPGTSGPITYALSAPDSLGISKHVGHQVQLTGKLKSPAAAPPAPSTGGTAAAKPAAPGAKPGNTHRTFEVSALKMISAKCS